MSYIDIFYKPSKLYKMQEETQLKSLNLIFKRKTKGGIIKATGKKAIVTVYTVSGNDESLKRFKEIQGEYYSEDAVTGKPNFFTRRVLGTGNATLNFTQGNEYVYPTDNLGLIDYDQIMQQAQSEGDVFTQQEVAKRKLDILLTIIEVVKNT